VADKEYYVTCSYLLALMEHAGKLFLVAAHDEKRQLLGLVLQNLKLNRKTLSYKIREPFATLLNEQEVLYGTILRPSPNPFYNEMSEKQRVAKAARLAPQFATFSKK
jgi:hypothetical protein